VKDFERKDFHESRETKAHPKFMKIVWIGFDVLLIWENSILISFSPI